MANLDGPLELITNYLKSVLIFAVNCINFFLAGNNYIEHTLM